MASDSTPGSPDLGSVLVVDNDSSVLIFIGRLLERRGLRSLFARSAAEAVSIATRTYVPIDLILSNITLHGSSGPEAVNRVREIRPGLSALYMSARIDGEIIRVDLMQRDSPDPDQARSKTFFDTVQAAISEASHLWHLPNN